MKQLLILMWTYDKLEAHGGVNTVFTLPNGGTFSTALTRNAARPDLVTRRAYSANGSSVYSYDTSFDLLGRPTNANDSVSLARAYLYNRRNELAEALVGTNAFGYAYDSIGNRTVASANSVTNTYAANNLNQYTHVDASQLTYDADGNLTQDDRFAHAYDAENRMISTRPIAPSEGDLAVVNAYDHKHRRVMKRVEQFDGDVWQTSETHTFAYDGCNIVLERDGSTRTVEYFWGNDLSGSEQGAGGVGGLLAVSIDGSFYFPCYDQIGNVVCYVSESGTIASQYVYDPYGNVISQYGTLADGFAIRFSTRYTDVETGLVSYKRRFYRPDHGRWLNRDPLEEDGGENLYAFCWNSPVEFVDIDGLVSVKESMEILYDLFTGVKPGQELGRTEVSATVKTPCKCNEKSGGWSLDEAIVEVISTVHHQNDGYKNHPGAALFSFAAERQHVEDIARGVRNYLIPELIVFEMIRKSIRFNDINECEKSNQSAFAAKISSLIDKIAQDSKHDRDDNGNHEWKGGL